MTKLCLKDSMPEIYVAFKWTRTLISCSLKVKRSPEFQRLFRSSQMVMIWIIEVTQWPWPPMAVPWWSVLLVNARTMKNGLNYRARSLRPSFSGGNDVFLRKRGTKLGLRERASWKTIPKTVLRMWVTVFLLLNHVSRNHMGKFDRSSINNELSAK